MFKIVIVSFMIGAVMVARSAYAGDSGFAPGLRTLVDAHNCYPYNGLYADRIDRALASGTPLAIENDLVWCTDSGTGQSRIAVAHGKPFKGTEPGLREYFFEKVRPVVEKALKDGNQGNWPLITLNINDLRGNEPEFFKAVWDLMGEYEGWLCTAVKQGPPDALSALDVKPVLVLTAGGPNETRFFHDEVAVGAKLRLFGQGDANPANNFRRWINYSWRAVETEGQRKAGEWTPAKAAKLKGLVDDAHGRGYWIRFYTLNGHPASMVLSDGLDPNYNFGTIEAAKVRWQACVDAHVDFVATDQCAELAGLLKGQKKP